MSMELNRPQRYRIITPSPTANVPVLSSITGGGTIVTLLPNGSEVDGIAVKAVWLLVSLSHGQRGYIALINVQPATTFAGSASAPLLKESMASRTPTSALVFLLVICGIFALVIGAFIISFYQKTCNAFSGCSDQVFPYQTTGLVVMLGGLVVLILAIALSRRLRNTYRS